MKQVLIAGASGFVGGVLVAELRSRGYQVTRLVRSPHAVRDEHSSLWRPDRGELDARLLDGADVVINLCGRNIGAGRWTDPVKRELRSSRLQPTRTLAAAIAAASPPPSLLINASATGYYGDCGEQELCESSPPGRGFLADLAAEWEQQAAAARSRHTRVAVLRLGMVVGRGGALAKMRPLFALGLGGPLGHGRQWWPWISIHDVAGVVCRLVDGATFDGPINLVAPQQLRCRDFVRTLGRSLHRPTVVPAPAFALRLVLGEMADALLLASARVRSAVLGDVLPYEFRAPTLDQALD